MKTKTKPSPYSPTPFHITRLALLVSAVIVTSILVSFLTELKSDGFKLPWTLLIVLIAAILTLLSLAITTTVYFCAFLSPLFNLILNIPLLLLWTFGLGLLIYNMYGALGHSCSKSNWGNNDGLSVCEAYKAMFAFVVLGWVFFVFAIVCDVKARRHQTGLGRYVNPAEDKQALVGHQSHDSISSEVPYGVINQEYRDRPVASTQPSFTSSNHTVDRFAPDYTTGHGGDIAMSDFRYRATPQPQEYYSGSHQQYQGYR